MSSPNMSLYKPILPRFPFDSLGEKAESAQKIFKPDETSASNSNALATAPRNPSMPLIPPRITPTVNTVMKNTEDPSWYVVISPRETRGLAGPLSISQLKQMYRVHEVKDNTLVWREGESNWQQLVHHTFLRSQLIYLPVLPPRVGSYNEELALFDPIVEVKPNIVENMTPLPETTVSKSCFQCGNVAVSNCVYDGEQHLDLFKTRSEVGTNEFASEVLPGFLWVGNASSVKHRSIVTLKFTLIVNCAKNMKSPQSQPPHFRCKFCPLVEEPKEDFKDFEVKEIMGMIEKVFDWVEMERISPENVAKADPKKPPYHGPTDQFGQPIKTAKDKTAFKHHLEEGQKRLEPRVLIWSKYGRERACVVAAAYLMKSYGISAERAIRIIKANRPEINIKTCYMKVLMQWQAKYIMGILLCIDCTEEKKKQIEDEKNRPPQPAELDYYDECVFLLKNHLPKLIGDQTELSLVSNVEEYLIKLRVSQFTSSPWSGLVDLDLSDRRLSDRTLAFLFQLLAGTDCLGCIRSIKLRNNYFSVLAARALLVAFYPKSSADPDDDYYMEDELMYPERDLSSLTLLDLSHNPTMDDLAVTYLSLFLKQCNSLVALNLFNCQLFDDLVAHLVSTLIKRTAVFQTPEYSALHNDHDDNSSVVSNVAELMCNESITDLNIGRNKIGKDTAAAIQKMFKQNAVLHTFRMEYATKIEPAQWKLICTAIKLYNCSMYNLILNGSDLSVKTCEHIANITSSYGTQLRKISLAKCGLVGLHLEALSKHLNSARFLHTLDLSGNNFEDGIEHLCSVIKGSVNIDEQHFPPLEYLDLSCCHINPQGAAQIAEAISTREHTFKCVDLSYNTIGPQNESFISHISNCSIVDLKLNYCQLKTSLTGSLFKIVAHRSRSHVYNPSDVQSLIRNRLLESLRFLYIAGNEVSDSIAEGLYEMLAKNISLEVIDLGYNSLTNQCASYFSSATKVASDDPMEKKIYPLHVNLIGNKCDPYLLETPGMARSKVHFFFGTNVNRDNDSLEGYAHMENRVRGKFVVQKQLDELYRKTFPMTDINHIS